MRRVALIIAVFLIVAGGGGVFFIHRSAYSSQGDQMKDVHFVFAKGEGIVSLSKRLHSEGLVSHEISFLYYLWRENHLKDLQAGEYLLSGRMTIPEIARKFLRGETVQFGTKVTFPEGWTAKEMADRLTSAGLPGGEFLALVEHPDSFQQEFPFLSMIPPGNSLEGFLFPDTYFFDSSAGADKIIGKMLENFVLKEDSILFGGLVNNAMTPYQRLVLASLLESEVRTEDDRRMVADIFLRRIDVGMPLQSDATVRYALGVTKVKHSLDDIAIASPYNTYVNKGLPPGPILNPGTVSIDAAMRPTPNAYWYFLNNPETGKTVFSTTFEEHIANKGKNGL